MARACEWRFTATERSRPYREATKPISDADRHAKKELKKHTRGVRPIERALEGRSDEEAEGVRVVAAGASRLFGFSAADLRLTDITAWRVLRQRLDYRHECRRVQLRFRRDPQIYLAALEQRLLTPSLPS